VDRAGNWVIADTGNNRIRVVAAATGTFYGRPMTAGDIYTVAGNGGTGHRGNGGPATKAGIKDPEDVAFDHSGNLVIAGGYGNNRIRVVAESTGTFYGKAMTAGDIYTVAGGGTDFGEGIPATDAELRGPGAVAVDHAGNLLISDSIFDNRIRVVAAATGTFYGQPMTAGDIYTVAGGGQGGLANGIPATDASVFHPAGVAVDGAGNILIAALHDSRIRVVAATTGTFYGQPMTAGDIYTVAGGGKGRVEDGGPATGARLLRPQGVTVGPAGSLVIADTGNGLIRTVTG
jgi:NHL repeat